MLVASGVFICQLLCAVFVMNTSVLYRVAQKKVEHVHFALKHLLSRGFIPVEPQGIFYFAERT